MGIFNFLKNKKYEQLVTCKCGYTFRFDWRKVHRDVKFAHVECPFCHKEMELGNPKHLDRHGG